MCAWGIENWVKFFDDVICYIQLAVLQAGLQQVDYTGQGQQDKQ